MKKLFELNKDAFKVGDNYVVVNDDEVKGGDWFFIGNIIHQAEEILDCDKDGLLEIHSKGYCNPYNLCKKIVFSTQFIHESIPVLDIESKEDLDKLGIECFEFLKATNPKGGIKEFIRLAVNFGYQKAKENYPFSEKDIRKAINFGYSGNHDSYAYKNFIQSLQQPKEIESIEVEYELNLNGKNGLDRARFIPSILSNGKVRCKVNYK